MKYQYCYICMHECAEDICCKCEYTGEKNEVPSRYDPFLPKKSNPTARKDPVNHPAHYETGKFECIEVMTEVFGVEAVQNFCLLNAFKYLYRCNHKNNKTEDIKKSQWYENKYLELESEKHGKS